MYPILYRKAFLWTQKQSSNGWWMAVFGTPSSLCASSLSISSAPIFRERRLQPPPFCSCFPADWPFRSARNFCAVSKRRDGQDFFCITCLCSLQWSSSSCCPPIPPQHPWRISWWWCCSRWSIGSSFSFGSFLRSSSKRLSKSDPFAFLLSFYRKDKPWNNHYKLWSLW